MRFARLGPVGSEIPVLETDDAVYDLRSITDDITGAFLAAGGLETAALALAAGTLHPLPDASALRVGAPITTPSKIVCIGLNYRDHAEESGAAVPTEPVVFMKDPGTIVGPFDDVLIPRAGVIVVPGMPFFADRPEANHARMSYSGVPDDRLVTGVRRMGELLTEALA